MYGGLTIAEDKRIFLNLRTLPARLESQEAGWLLGFNKDEISIITAAGVLKPVGKPAPCAAKYYLTSDLRKHAANPSWMDQASRAVSEFWRRRNADKKRHKQSTAEN